MRITALEKFVAERTKDYDPELHPMVQPGGQVKMDVLEHVEGRMRVRVHFIVVFTEVDGGLQHGKVDGSALITVTDPEIPKRGTRLPDRILSLIQGGLSDDVLLPISVAIRAMRLPNLMISPVTFEQASFTPVPMGKPDEGEPVTP